MRAQDVMTRTVVAVKPDTPVQEIAAMMVEKRISGIPVVADDGAIVGVVSQSDLLHRKEVGTDRRHKWWAQLLSSADDIAREYAKAHGLRARDVMTRHVITVRSTAELADVAEILDNNRIKRVPVVDDGQLVGILTRTDLVRALVAAQPKKSGRTLDNASLHKSLQERIRKEPWTGVDQNYVRLLVNDGVVELWGYVESEVQHGALRALVEETEGVSSVVDKLIVGVPSRGGARLI